MAGFVPLQRAAQVEIDVERMKQSQDHFSAIAAEYRVGRITYPKSLYEYLSNSCKERRLAWDCATGSGQAATDLSIHFDRVIATDISESLLALTQNGERSRNLTMPLCSDLLIFQAS
jgi:methylase of polypeptide subunit release factors